jgi:hypothetical protein
MPVQMTVVAIKAAVAMRTATKLHHECVIVVSALMTLIQVSKFPTCAGLETRQQVVYFLAAYFYLANVAVTVGGLSLRQ